MVDKIFDEEWEHRFYLERLAVAELIYQRYAFTKENSEQALELLRRVCAKYAIEMCWEGDRFIKKNFTDEDIGGYLKVTEGLRDAMSPPLDPALETNLSSLPTKFAEAVKIVCGEFSTK